MFGQIRLLLLMGILLSINICPMQSCGPRPSEPEDDDSEEEEDDDVPAHTHAPPRIPPMTFPATPAPTKFCSLPALTGTIPDAATSSVINVIAPQEVMYRTNKLATICAPSGSNSLTLTITYEGGPKATTVDTTSTDGQMTIKCNADGTVSVTAWPGTGSSDKPENVIVTEWKCSQ